MGKLEVAIDVNLETLPNPAMTSNAIKATDVVLFPHSANLPQVSVIVPIYNGESDLSGLLNCLKAQTYPTDRVEYLLVDNGSQDQTAQLLSAAAATEPNFPLRPLSEATIQSSYAARNAGIRSAKGQILVFTDADCRPQPNWLEQLVQPFIDPEVGIVAGEILALPGDSLLERYADRHNTLSQVHTLAHPFQPYGQTANLAIRQTILTQVGLFRPYLTTGGDADLCWRILQQGSWKIELAASAIVYHRHRSTVAELQSQWRRYGRSNRYLHDLYGVNLTRELTLKEAVYRSGRWLLKEIPAALLKSINQQKGATHWVDTLIDTPLDLLCRWARSQGQSQAKLPDAAHKLVWLNSEINVNECKGDLDMS